MKISDVEKFSERFTSEVLVKRNRSAGLISLNFDQKPFRKSKWTVDAARRSHSLYSAKAFIDS